MNKDYMDGDLVTVYAFDEKGYFAGLTAWQYTAVDGLIKTDDATETAPWGDGQADPTVFYKWDGTAWQAESKPTHPDQILGVKVATDDATQHGYEMRELVSALAQVEGYYEETDAGFVSVKKHPGKTEAEKMEEALNAEIRAYEEKVKDLNYRIGLAVLANDEEEIASLRAEYAQLQEEE